ncbi:MAG: cold-shock protein [Chloroflexi bacterium]|nr:cold-shock protein [Chloroflexota bacterium]|tara:strand:- start:19588 stop:19884 length:297 start_codon:yes stop_codon:yes gene_type:complete
MSYIFYVLALMIFSVNLLSLVFLFIDKRFALKGYRRVPEKYFFSLALIGGWIFGLLTINAIRHKNRKREFLVKYYSCLFASVILFTTLIYLISRFLNI